MINPIHVEEDKERFHEVVCQTLEDFFETKEEFIHEVRLE